MGKSSYIVVAFDSTHAAFAAQKSMQGVELMVIPTPREITAGCGISLRLEQEQLDAVCLALDQVPDIQGVCRLFLCETEEKGRGIVSCDLLRQW